MHGIGYYSGFNLITFNNFLRFLKLAIHYKREKILEAIYNFCLDLFKILCIHKISKCPRSVEEEKIGCFFLLSQKNLSKQYKGAKSPLEIPMMSTEPQLFSP